MISIEARLKKIMVKHLGVAENQVAPQARLIEDLNMDSIDALDLLMALNEEFNTNITPEKMSQVETVQDLINNLIEKP